MSDIILGIDLGTTNSVVAVADGGQVRVLSDETGHRLVPSVVSFHPDGQILIGDEARERRLIDAEHTIYSVKRLIGRPFDSPEVKAAQQRFAFEIVPSASGGVVVQVRNETYALTEISAFVLRQIRKVAEEVLGQPCAKAVITVPANFNELQRSATKAAARVAGLEVSRIINEPTAAALAYGYGQERAEKVAVYDLGGGTFDLTLLELEQDVFEVVGTAGDSYLGGDDLDLVVAEAMADTFLAEHHWDPREDAQAFERLRAAGEWAKCQLSNEDHVKLMVEELAYGPGGEALDLHFRMTREELEDRIRPLLTRSFEVCAEALEEAGLAANELDSVILVGGSTRVPLVRSMVADFFGKTPRTDIDPDLVVAQGAAIHGYAIQGRTKEAQKPLAVKQLSLSDLKAAQDRRKLRQSTLPKQPAFAPTAQVDFKPSAPGAPRTTRALETASGVPNLPKSDRPPSIHPMGPATALPPLGVPRAPAKDGGTVAYGTRLDRLSDPSPAPARDSIEIDFGYAEEVENVAPGGILQLDAPSVDVDMVDLSGLQPMPPSLPPAPPPAPAPEIGGAWQEGPGEAMEFDLDDIEMIDDESLELEGLPEEPTPLAPASPESFIDEAPFELEEPVPEEATAPVMEMADVAPPLLMDVTPHSLGLRTAGDFCQQLIRRNAPIPAEQTRVFTTGRDHQDSVLIDVAQGEDRRFDENEPLGRVELSELRAARRGDLKIEVTFMIDASGTLEVKAVDLDTGRAQHTRIALLGGADDAEIEAMRARQQAALGANA